MADRPGIGWPNLLARRAFLRLAGATTLATGAGPAAVKESSSAASEGSRQGSAATATPKIWIGAFEVKHVWGYADKHSVAPAEGFDLMLSTGPDQEPASGRVEFFRIGHHPPEGHKSVWTSEQVTVSSQPVSRSASAIGAGWPPTLHDIDTKNWPPGYYSADFVHASGMRDLQIAQIVVLNPRRSGQVLVRLGTNTYQAYTAWGGHSLYPTGDESQRGNAVSFDRPSWPEFFTYDVYLARWLEALGQREGFAVDYATNFDVYRNPDLIAAYPLVISGSHDEYWSKEEFDAFERRIFTLGRNTAFFGANAAYFQVRYGDLDRPPGGTDRGRILVCYKRLTDPIVRRESASNPLLLATTYFREEGRRPESMLMGVAYQGWFQPGPDDIPRYPYLVARTDLPFFSGTGLQPGDVAADVVGYEWDNRDPDGDSRRLWQSGRSLNRPLPLESIQVLFRGAPVDNDGKQGLAEAVYFESPAGARVFSAGSIRWAWGLGKPGFEREPFKRFNENLVKALLNR